MQVELQNTTKKLCVIGDPVLHSKSPAIQNAMIAALGLDYIYLCQPVPRGEAGRWLSCARYAGYAGFNATGAGFLRALKDELGLDAAGRRVVLLGSGGAAKAVSAALAGVGARVTVCNRTVEKARALCRMDGEHLTPAGFETEILCKLCGEVDLLVNCTSLGMAGTEGDFADLRFVDALPAGAAVCDAIYAPPETSLLRRARAGGHPAMNGLGMLVWQAVLALKHFTGVDFDEETAKTAALTALKGLN